MSLRERARPDWSHKRPLSIPGVMMLRTLAYKFLSQKDHFYTRYCFAQS